MLDNTGREKPPEVPDNLSFLQNDKQDDEQADYGGDAVMQDAQNIAGTSSEERPKEEANQTVPMKVEPQVPEPLPDQLTMSSDQSTIKTEASEEVKMEERHVRDEPLSRSTSSSKRRKKTKRRDGYFR